MDHHVVSVQQLGFLFSCIVVDFLFNFLDFYGDFVHLLSVIFIFS